MNKPGIEAIIITVGLILAAMLVGMMIGITYF
jgi:hypothetical protein